jgi:hypothetical protein
MNKASFTVTSSETQQKMTLHFFNNSYIVKVFTKKVVKVNVWLFHYFKMFHQLSLF